MMSALILLSPLPASAYQREASRYVDVGGTRIHYFEAGDPSGRPIVFVHGLYGTAVDFLTLMRVMKPGYRCIALDFPGCGRSDKPDIHYSTAYLVEVLKGFTDALGLKSFVLAGHSMGGQVSIYFALSHHESVEKLILIDPYGLKGEEGGFAPLTRIGFFVDIAFALTLDFMVDMSLKAYIFHDPDRIPYEYYESLTSLFRDPDSRRAAARITREIIGMDPVDGILRGVTQDTLLIWGEDDRLLPAAWREGFMEGLPNPTLRLIPECGHMPIIEQAGRTAWLLEEFLGPG